MGADASAKEDLNFFESVMARGNIAKGGIAVSKSPRAVEGELTIGDLAALAGVSRRTLRYYEERGLLLPTGRTPGGERRYGPEDFSQLQRILELKEGIGLSLNEVKTFIQSERRLYEIRAFYRTDEAVRHPAKRRDLLREAIEIRRRLVARVTAKIEQLERIEAELEADIDRALQILDGNSRG